ncbi:YbaB/EbfC family nucleoid-associated protein [Campylobacter canadensis]|uniref:Nucleoid-associated protein AVCANL283_02970 n=1 Tax=Campylobacter canadensis TaxID=449520 RepID=A0ABS7WRX7_9BACT|nr:YbaB/EbfC family nucleoid-associated protein [Campylobacter canadensis]MBZ7987082.1 YbaB/EbfC family nucleoid-associated protein [Campylobacter canadensis]MBZ7994696.1 YbaB/EbfC family nucleoid-associated protein [Campylobacter canadensis]MBZ7996192.1 YbaB/EbfC family nucleoid-associated protein [Campylobacter canadensis]MBZ7998118.1 YbaB/EbfC family nucleoid-associated protein [Campylobacter canadensis]MBZ7999992.1 YbaB/EbfC family nucleoid-associated protein [Campylobacter canadensis]
MFKDFDLSKMQEMLENVQQKAKEFEDELEKKEFCASSGAGMCKVKVNAKFQILDISIDDELLNDKSSMQILLISALNDALKQASNSTKDMATNMFFKAGQ